MQTEARSNYSIDELITCARRELAQRRRVYRRLVNEQKMSADEASYEIGAMAAILANLENQRQPKLL